MERQSFDLNTLPRVRADAIASGVSHYFTGKPCANGHIDVRVAKGALCLACARERQTFRLHNDSAYRDLHRKSCLKRITKILLDPERRKEIRAREGELHRTSEVRKANKAKADKIRFQREEVKVRTRELQKILYREKYVHDPAHVEKQKQRGAKWAKENKDRANAKTAARRARRIQAQPPCLTIDDVAKMQVFYNRAQTLSEETGVKHDVDHIVPLNHPLVCGLHVPWNLQVLTSAQNRAKRNTFNGE